ncbi:hypothetical protein [Sphingobacterium lumbrici]|uniref:hypothetical protein n=1 Tax=Sphingobacterium lumbrici TaxID=2559600 RepID=UPI0015E32FF6|nr:hypothetical protein [Sphingobacterium lumbrici]
MSPVKLLAMAIGGTILTAKRFERHAPACRQAGLHTFGKTKVWTSRGLSDKDTV